MMAWCSAPPARTASSGSSGAKQKEKVDGGAQMTDKDTEQAPDPAEVAKILGEVAERSSNVLADFMTRHANGKGLPFTDEFGIARAFMDMWAKLLANPMALAVAQMNMYFDYLRLWQSSWLKLLGQAADPVAAPAQGDNRFKDEDWQNNFLFDYIKQSYLI